MLQTATKNSTITNRDELVALINDCRVAALPIVDYGIAHTGLGHPPPAQHVALSQRGGIIEHYERDLTLRVAAGATIAQIQDALKPTNQFLAVDADDDLTLGEAIAHNVYGPSRLTYGGLRDQLLGLRYMDGLGRDIHVGGRTVKNVAGYDVTRFMVGSLGELGVVYEATLRVYAIPQRVMSVELGIKDPGALDSLLANWLLADAAPTALSLQHDTSDWRIHLAYFGTSMSCATQLRSLETLIAGEAGFHIVTVQKTTLEDFRRQQSVRRAWRRQAAALVKIVVPPMFAGATCSALAALEPQLQFDALPAHGCIFTGGELSSEQTVRLTKLIDHRLTDSQGVRVWHQRPPGTQTIEPFGPPQPDWFMLEKLKTTMDPHMLLNPGRFLGRARLAAGGTAA